MCEALHGGRPGSTAPHQEHLASASFLNVLHWIAPGGFYRLRSGWDSAHESGATDRWGSGAKGSFAQAAETEELRKDIAL